MSKCCRLSCNNTQCSASLLRTKMTTCMQIWNGRYPARMTAVCVEAPYSSQITSQMSAARRHSRRNALRLCLCRSQELHRHRCWMRHFHAFVVSRSRPRVVTFPDRAADVLVSASPLLLAEHVQLPLAVSPPALQLPGVPSLRGRAIVPLVSSASLPYALAWLPASPLCAQPCVFSFACALRPCRRQTHQKSQIETDSANEMRIETGSAKLTFHEAAQLLHQASYATPTRRSE